MKKRFDIVGLRAPSPSRVIDIYMVYFEFIGFVSASYIRSNFENFIFMGFI